MAQIERVAKEHGAPAAADGAGSLEDVMAQAVKDDKLVAVRFTDPKKAKKAEALQAALDADELAELKDRFVWIEQPVKIDGKRNPVAKLLGVSSGPYLVFLDPRGDELSKKMVIGKTNKPKSLQDSLEGAISKAESRSK